VSSLWCCIVVFGVWPVVYSSYARYTMCLPDPRQTSCSTPMLTWPKPISSRRSRHYRRRCCHVAIISLLRVEQGRCMSCHRLSGPSPRRPQVAARSGRQRTAHGEGAGGGQAGGKTKLKPARKSELAHCSTSSSSSGSETVSYPAGARSLRINRAEGERAKAAGRRERPKAIGGGVNKSCLNPGARFQDRGVLLDGWAQEDRNQTAAASREMASHTTRINARGGSASYIVRCMGQSRLSLRYCAGVLDVYSLGYIPMLVSVLLSFVLAHVPFSLVRKPGREGKK
jgi:hypothetical protein